MLDTIFTAATIVCFAVALLYVTACDRMKGRPSGD